MPRITSKGQVTIPQEIREKFGFQPGINVEIITEDNKAIIIKSTARNPFMEWLGRGGKQTKKEIDNFIDILRGRTDG
jgi:AbrB family looped-hinge helix DNA binding protein